MLRIVRSSLVRPRTVAQCLASVPGTAAGAGGNPYSTAAGRATTPCAAVLARAPAARSAPHCAGLRADARSACVRFASPSAALLQWRTYIRGGATTTGTAAFAEKNQALSQYMQLPQARGWRVSRMGWGSDDVGKPLDVRYRALWQAVQKGGCNVIRFDLDTVLERLARYDKGVGGSGGGAAGASSTQDSGAESADEAASAADDSAGEGEEAGAGAAAGGGKRWGNGVRPYDEMAEDVVWEANALTQMFQRGINRSEVRTPTCGGWCAVCAFVWCRP